MKMILVLSAMTILVSPPTYAQREEGLRLIVTTGKSSNPIVKTTSVSPRTLIATVREALGEPITGLQKENFEIYRGRRKGQIISVKETQRTRELRRRVVLIIDNSASMAPHVESVTKDLDSLLASFGRNTAVAVVLFSNYRNTLFEVEGKALALKSLWFTMNKSELKRYIREDFLSRNLVESTNLYDAVYAGHQLLEPSRLRKAEDVGIVLSDGEDNASTVNAHYLLSTDWGSTRFYTIDYLTQRMNPFLFSLSRVTGGQHYQAGKISDLQKVFQTITERIESSGYEIEYQFRENPRGAVTFYASTLGIADTSWAGVEVDTLIVEEQVVKQQFPLLTYVFFGPGNVEIPPRYHRFSSWSEASVFNESSVHGGVLDRYYHLLNIVGARLRDNPQSVITVTGCSDNEALDSAVPMIGLKRAEMVKSYFENVWKIDAQRIHVSSRGLPETPSAISLPEGQAENRRVEIISSDWEIMKPVVFELKETSAIPREAELYLEIHAPEGLKKWALPFYTGTAIWREFFGTEGPFVSLKWDWRNQDSEFPRSSLRYQLTIEDSIDEKTTLVSKTIPVKLLTIERKQIERFPEKDVERINLILFEFNSAALGSRNERILGEIGGRIRPQSMVTVAGFTDIIGEDQVNQLLSERRALAVAAKLTELTKIRGPIRTMGFGELAPVFPNELPEGRFYNRTVQILIETYR